MEYMAIYKFICILIKRYHISNNMINDSLFNVIDLQFHEKPILIHSHVIKYSSELHVTYLPYLINWYCMCVDRGGKQFSIKSTKTHSIALSHPLIYQSVI